MKYAFIGTAIATTLFFLIMYLFTSHIASSMQAQQAQHYETILTLAE